MRLKITRHQPLWQSVKGGRFQKDTQVCPRCNNQVRYVLVSSGGYGFTLATLFDQPSDKCYAFKCPICPNTETVSPETAKAIIKGG